MAEKTEAKLTHCPECGADLAQVDPIKHAQSHWGRELGYGDMSQEAEKREAALYKAGGQEPPRRRR